MGSFDAIKGAGAALNATSITKSSGSSRTVEKKSVDVKFGKGEESYDATSFKLAGNPFSAKGNPFSAEYTDAIADGLRNSTDRRAFMLKLLST